MEAREFLNQIKEKYGVSSDEELAVKLGTSKASIDKWIQRNTIPDKWKIILGQKSHLDSNLGIQIANNSTINGNVNINTSEFNHSEDIKELINLLKYAPSDFITTVIERLRKFKSLSKF